MGSSGREEGEGKADRTVRRSYRLTLIVAGGFIFLGAASFGASCLSFAAVSRTVLRSNPRAADSLASNFAGVLFRLRLCSFGFLMVAFLTVLYRRRLQAWIEETVWPMPRFLGGATSSLVDGWKADGKLITWMVPILIVIGAVLRMRFLFEPMGFDEADTFISFASKPIYLGLSLYSTPNNHIFHTLLMHIAWRLFGDHEWAIRLPVLLAGILLIPVTYCAGRVLYGKDSALIAAALVTAASPVVSYSVNARGYILICVFFLLLLIVGRYLLDHDSSPGWLLWALIAAVGFFTIPTMLYAAGTVAVYLVQSSLRMETEMRHRFQAHLGLAVAIAGFATTLLYLPVLVVSGPNSLFANSFVHPRTLARLSSELPANVWETWQMLIADVPRPLVWILAAGFVIGLIYQRRVAPTRVSVPIAAVLCIAPLLLVQRVVPYPRVWLFLIPLCAIVSCAGLWFLVRLLANRFGTRRLSGISAAMALGCALLMGSAVLRGSSVSSSRGSLPGTEGAAAWIKGQLMRGDIVFGKFPVTAPLTYYFRRNGIHFVARAAPCNDISLVYSFSPPFTGVRATGEARVLAVVLDRSQKVGMVLSIMCLPLQTYSEPKLVYGGEGMSVYESYIDPRVLPSASNSGMGKR